MNRGRNPEKPSLLDMLRNSRLSDFVASILALTLRDDEMVVPYRPIQKNMPETSIEQLSVEQLEELEDGYDPGAQIVAQQELERRKLSEKNF
jgi:hypothetical protein